MSQAKQATVKWYDKKKGYGFLVPKDGSPDVFVHVRQLQKSDIDELVEGMRVTYETGIYNGKSQAINISII